MPAAIDDGQRESLKLLVVLSKAYKTLMDKIAKDVKSYGLSPSEFAIIEVLYAKGRVPLQQVGEKILITSGTMTYNIDKLEKKKLLQRVPCSDDRRVIYAEITAAGIELFDDIFPRHAACIDQLMTGLSQDQKRQAIELLKLLGKGAKEK